MSNFDDDGWGKPSDSWGTPASFNTREKEGECQLKANVAVDDCSINNSSSENLLEQLEASSSNRVPDRTLGRYFGEASNGENAPPSSGGYQRAFPPHERPGRNKGYKPPSSNSASYNQGGKSEKKIMGISLDDFPCATTQLEPIGSSRSKPKNAGGDSYQNNNNYRNSDNNNNSTRSNNSFSNDADNSNNNDNSNSWDKKVDEAADWNVNVQNKENSAKPELENKKELPVNSSWATCPYCHNQFVHPPIPVNKY